MTRADKLLLADLLDMASNRLSTDVCDEYSLSHTELDDDDLKALEDYMVNCGDDPDLRLDSDSIVPHWLLMDYYAEKLRAEVDNA